MSFLRYKVGGALVVVAGLVVMFVGTMVGRPPLNLGRFSVGLKPESGLDNARKGMRA